MHFFNFSPYILLFELLHQIINAIEGLGYRTCTALFWGKRSLLLKKQVKGFPGVSRAFKKDSMGTFP